MNGFQGKVLNNLFLTLNHEKASSDSLIQIYKKYCRDSSTCYK